METVQERKKLNTLSNRKRTSSFFAPVPVQAKLKVNAPGDQYEQEADTVADQVINRLAENSSHPEPAKIPSSSPNEANAQSASGASNQINISKSSASTFPPVQAKCSNCEAEEKENLKEEEIQRMPESKISLQANVGEDEEESTLMAKHGATSQPTVSDETASQLYSSKGSGDPLPKNTKSEMEKGFGVDFSNVRIHTNPGAETMSKNLGAQAFTHGSDIYFNSGKFDTQSHGGKKLLAHELTHVVQQNGGASHGPKKSPIPFDTIQRDGSSELQPCTEIGSCLGRIAMIADSQRRNPQPATSVADDLMAQLRGPLLSDPDALSEMTLEVSESFSANVFGLFLNRLETDARARGEMSPLERMRAQEEHQRTIPQMQDLTAPRRGPYGTRGPGVALPVIAGVLHPLYNMYRSAKGFIRGVIGGFRQTATPRDYQRLVEKLAGSVIITSVFPVVFLAGAIVGIVQDIVGAIVGIYRAVVNFDEIVASAKQIITVMFSDQGEQVGEELGIQTGIGYVSQLRSLLSQNVFSFTYNLGRIIGPTIIYTIISLLGLPVLLGAGGLSLRVIRSIRAILGRVPGARRLQALLRLRRIQRRGLAPGAGGLVIQGGRVRLTIAKLLEWEGLGGHMLQRHGPFHTRQTLLRRVLNETSLDGPPAPRDLPGGARTTDFRVWQGNSQPHASVWRSQQEMLDAVGEVISDNIGDIERVTAGGSELILSRIPLNRHVGNGWVTAIRGSGERGIYWADNLQHATVVIRPVAGGGWRVHTAYPEL
ncbi:DUF4157 domain-containing protein [Algoriphagus sp. D3-2-R+10]|uniref:eCIS core domain-containing protein n=1 Tax=Algoriphagus aurantiacus TaxID=3103948 RepID=UPI002B3B226C|nr:DUF4157 domain-containing protein [Algoriphagus sp. D3-2-R+10]MEB2773765.1 DUF4157 domain-containing protein [Algoriphagus sp. D3-2-R+10]